MLILHVRAPDMKFLRVSVYHVLLGVELVVLLIRLHRPGKLDLAFTDPVTQSVFLCSLCLLFKLLCVY